jgi:hypothetical protein
MKIIYRFLKPLAIAAFLSLTLWGCEKTEPDSPPENQVNPENILTIAQLRAMFTGQTVRFTDNYHIFGVVTTDEISGNFHRSHFIQDATAAICIRLDSGEDLVVGDSVRVALRGTTLNAFNNLLQVDSVIFRSHLVRQASGIVTEIPLVTIPQITAGGLQGRLVRLENLQVLQVDLAKPFVGNINLEDCDGNRIVLRTSSFAYFANSRVPQGRGSIVAIVSVFGTTWQLLLRNTGELDFAGTRCPG